MNARAEWLLKFFIWVLYIGGNALSLVLLVTDWRELGVNYWALAYVPMNLSYLGGGLYVIFNFAAVLPRYRVKLVRALLALFAVDAVFAGATMIASKWYPNTFNPPLEGVPDMMIVAGTATGFGFSLLILFIMLRLINTVSGSGAKKPAVWMTAFAWLTILLMVGAVVGFLLGA